MLFVFGETRIRKKAVCIDIRFREWYNHLEKPLAAFYKVGRTKLS